MDTERNDAIARRQAPNPGIAAVLSVVIPGLGQVYNGHLAAGLVWFLAASASYPTCAPGSKT